MMVQPQRPRSDTDRGLTLVEVLITVGLLGLVATVLSAAIIVIFNSENGVVRVTAESHDTQQGVNYFPLDVQAGPVERAAYSTGAATGCSPVGTNVVQFEKAGKLIAYRLIDDGGSTARLDRQVCDAGTLANLETVNIADRLDGTVSPPASIDFVLSGAFVQSIELTLAQDRTDARVVASPRPEPRNSAGDCETDNPMEAAHGYGVFIENDVVLVSGEVTGWIGLGGTLSWRSDVDVATGTMSDVDYPYGLYAPAIDWDVVVKTVTDLDVATNVATATVASHGYTSGQQVVVDGTGDAVIDGNAFPITVIGADTFEFSVTTGDATDLDGTVVPVDVVSITDLDVASGVATTTAPGHGFGNGQRVVIVGTGNGDIDGSVVEVSVGGPPNRFTFPTAAADVSNLTGSAVTGAVLAVGDNTLAIGGSFVRNGDFVYENPPVAFDHYIRLDANPATVDATAGQIPIADDFEELRDCAAGLARLIDLCAIEGCANEVDVTVDPASNTINACSQGAVPQVFNVPEEFFAGGWTFTTSGPGCQGFSQTRPLILNVIETVDDPETAADEDDGNSLVTINAAPGDWSALGDRKNILFNFPNAASVTVTNGFYGQIFAPFSDVVTNGFVEGGVIAANWTHEAGLVDSNDDLFDNPISWP